MIKIEINAATAIEARQIMADLLGSAAPIAQPDQTPAQAPPEPEKPAARRGRPPKAEAAPQPEPQLEPQPEPQPEPEVIEGEVLAAETAGSEKVAEEPKPEAPKPEAPKPEAPKPEAPKPAAADVEADKSPYYHSTIAPGVRTLVAARGRDVAVKLLTDYGAVNEKGSPTALALSEDSYDDFMTELNDLLKGE